MNKNKYNLSFKRIVSRLLLTGFVGIIFGIAMFPFLRVADGLLYAQKSVIGGQNIIKMVILWGIFTALVSAFTFWKKRFRMVSVFLIICWFISIVFATLITINNSSSLTCKRANPYVTEKEFDRALDLIAQRMDIENNYGTYWGNAFNYRNCIDIQYSQDVKKLGAEGLFLEEDPSLQDIKILISPDYKSFDDLSIAAILIHELAHAGQYIYETENKAKLDCFGTEAEAFTVQVMFLDQLNQEEIRSIFARIRENAETNPALNILLGTEMKQAEAYSACDRLMIENNLTQLQFNECVWTGTKNKLEIMVKADTIYQEQCKQY